jgi:flagellar FliJ protein
LPKFVFRLDKYLGLKEKLEDQKKNEYLRAVRKLEEERERKRGLEREKKSAILEQKEKLSGNVDPLGYSYFSSLIEIIKVRIIEQDKRVSMAEEFVRRKQIELLEAMKERKAIDILKDRAREEYNREEKLIEQKLIDQVVSYKYNKEMSMRV